MLELSTYIYNQMDVSEFIAFPISACSAYDPPTLATAFYHWDLSYHVGTVVS